MESKEHVLKLKDGRLLAYHTFPDTEQTLEGRHPVLYFHGFPGCGLEGGAVFADVVARKGGRLYAIDRPGMGKTSSPYAHRDSDEETSVENIDVFVGSIWELVDDQGWEDFSVIGVSGGGPYALAVLASSLERKSPENAAQLRNVCLAGSICTAAGTEGMLPSNISMLSMVNTATTSRWSRFQLRASFASMAVIFSYIYPYIPVSWIGNLMSSSLLKGIPPADVEWFSDEQNIGKFQSVVTPMAAQGAYPGMYDDAMIVMKSSHSYEELLRKKYRTEDSVPRVGIFHGLMDKNVPPSHAKYLHQSVFREQSQLVLYNDLGHVSLVTKSDDIASFATAGISS